MKLIKEDLHWDFLGKRLWCLIGSGAVILAGIVAFALLGGLNYGIDFRGGTLIQVQFSEPHSIGEIRGYLATANLGDVRLQAFGDAENNEFLVTLPQVEQGAIEAGEVSPAEEVEQTLAEHLPSMEVRRVESVGPKVGEELKRAAFAAIVFSLVAILLYVWLRFQWRFGVGAVVALFHDVLIVLTLFVLTQKEITLTVVAAVLTVAGYSINDTIVIFDRVRENLRRTTKKGVQEVFNDSINQTLSRTLLTSGTTLIVVLAMYLLGGEIINDFALALLVGVLTGTYSTIYIASPVVLQLRQWFPPRIK